MVHVALVALALVVGLALVTVTTYTPVVLITLAVAHVMGLTVVDHMVQEIQVLDITVEMAVAEPASG